MLVFARRRWRCGEPTCEVNTWSEHHGQIPSRASLTGRARRRLADMVNIDGSSIAAAAAEFGVGWHTANTAVAEHTDPHVDDPARLEGVTSVGVDEKRFLNATAGRRTVFTTQIVDLDRHRILDVIQGRSRDVLEQWLVDRGAHWCARRRLIVFFQHCADAEVPELGRLARTIDRWHREVLAYHSCGNASNGRVENLHMLAEKTRRNAHGFTNHSDYRRRLIGRYGIKWATIPTRRIRGRKPRLIA